ncbi:MAG: DMT family transporter [Bacteroidia bacterium]|nr:DMT family transporter [Bacteroidia bacterium]
MFRSGAVNVAAGAALFGLIPLFVSLCGSDSVVLVAAGRAMFAALFILPVLLISKSSIRIKSSTAIHYFIWSLSLSAAMLSYFQAIRTGGHALAGTVIGVQPVFVALAARILLKENIRPSTIIVSVISLSGVLMIGLSTGIRDVSTDAVLWALLSAALLGINFTYHLKFLSTEPVLRLVFYQSFFQIPILLCFAPFCSGGLQLSSLLPMMCLGIVCTAGAYLLIYHGSRSIKSQHIGLFQITENIVPVITGVLIMNESVSLDMLAGILLIIVPVIVLSLHSSAKNSVTAGNS